MKDRQVRLFLSCEEGIFFMRKVLSELNFGRHQEECESKQGRKKFENCLVRLEKHEIGQGIVCTFEL